jgi:hypothetical protein
MHVLLLNTYSIQSYLPAGRPNHNKEKRLQWLVQESSGLDRQETLEASRFTVVAAINEKVCGRSRRKKLSELETSPSYYRAGK